MKSRFWKRDWFSALAISTIFGVAAFQGAAVLETLEGVAYDLGASLASRSARTTDKIAVVAIDEASIDKIGRWPWPRGVLADGLKHLSQGQPKLIALQVSLSDAQSDPGLAYIRELSAFVGESQLRRLAPADTAQIVALLKQAEEDLDQDRKLAKALPQAGNLFLPMFFNLGVPLDKPNAPLPGFVQRNRLSAAIQQATGITALTTTSAVYPLPEFGSATAGVGHMNLIPDVDGAVRTEPLVLEHYGDYYPSLALLLAARQLNLGPRDIIVSPGQSVALGDLTIKTDSRMRMLTGFYPIDGDNSPYTYYSFHDVQSGKVSPSVFKDRMVLIGTTAVGVGNFQVTPITKSMSEPALTANAIASILNQNFFQRPDWALVAEATAFAGVLLYLVLALPHLSAGVGAAISLFLLLTLIGGGHYLLITDHLWVKTASPALLLLVGHLLLITKRFVLNGQVRLESDSAHTNRMLGLAFQGQGQLDMALDKFRTLPVDDSVLDLIYNVALDFERKRQFSKARDAYDYILNHAPRFKDAADRRKRMQQADSTVIIGGRASSPGGTLIVDGVDHKPTLGRYVVEKELGRGAMGAVYLGRDPKINRVVAIKTLALSEEFEDKELAEVKARFFREAETAGRLNHPNIVTIYDAGEEQDLAYIAMEYLQGENLTRYTEQPNLLPVRNVLQMIGKVADALDYAHKQDVVHRDIKPANIMYDKKDQGIKVTDFGIARITASRRTKTGVVMGTPSYMSPEQFSGKQIDGRSDLFSLGVMLYEMLCGQQPFQGDSLTSLLYQITNEKPRDILKVRRDLPSFIRPVINKALQKEPKKRFQTGAEFRQVIDQCLQSLQKTGR